MPPTHPLRIASRLTALLVASAAAVGCRDPDQLYRHYATHAEAVAAGEVARGWLPAWVPDSAADIHIQGDVDTNEAWLRFDLPAAARDSLRLLLLPAPATALQGPRPSGDRGWWFEGLIELQPANDAALYADLYRGSGQPVPASTAVAFDRVSRRVYVWPTSAEPAA